MTSQIGALPRAAFLSFRKLEDPLVFSAEHTVSFERTKAGKTGGVLRVRVSDGGDSYLHMWKKAVENERKEIEFQKIVENSGGNNDTDVDANEDLEKKSEEFQKILEVPKEERNLIQRMQVIDRATAAISAARAALEESRSTAKHSNSDDSSGGGNEAFQDGKFNFHNYVFCGFVSIDFLLILDFVHWISYENLRFHCDVKPNTIAFVIGYVANLLFVILGSENDNKELMN